MNPQPPVLETGALPVELLPSAEGTALHILVEHIQSISDLGSIHDTTGAGRAVSGGHALGAVPWPPYTSPGHEQEPCGGRRDDGG